MGRASIAFLVLIATALGCARMPGTPEPPTSSVRHETSRNYTLGVRTQVNVGDSVVRVKDYFVTQVTAPYVTPTQSFTFSPGVNLSFVEGQRYRVVGNTERAGRTWSVVQHPEETNWTILVSEDGQIHGEPFRQVSGFKGPFPISPAGARMKRVMGEERVETSKPYKNYEIIYNGTDKNSLQLTYREFSPDDYARTAFYQNLTYDAKSPTIRFRKFRIEVHSATNESISYTVLEEDPGNY